MSTGPSRRIGVFGGTFDPPHVGHVTVAGAVLEALSLDRMLFVPANASPLKPEGPAASGATRARMLRAALAGDDRFEVSEIELEREGPSFTVDTLERLAADRPDAGLVLVIGVDQWATFGRWHRPGDIAALAEIAVMTRGGEGAGAVDPGLGDGPPVPFTEVSVPRVDVSSTDVRRRIREGRPVDDLVPEPVRRIIEAEKLYI